MSVSDNLAHILSTLPPEVRLVAVSKFHPVEAIRQAYDAGARDFGESRVQELAAKAPALPDDIRWHFIGHLQTNKVRQLVKYVHTIQSIDSVRLLHLVDAEAARIGRRIDVMLQAHVALEETKFGMTPDEMLTLITGDVVDSLCNVRIVGIMGMASNTDDMARVEADFAALKTLHDALRNGVMRNRPEFVELSMGMSHDYPLALRHGATMVRVGTDIFGERQY